MFIPKTKNTTSFPERPFRASAARATQERGCGGEEHREIQSARPLEAKPQVSSTKDLQCAMRWWLQLAVFLGGTSGLLDSGS